MKNITHREDTEMMYSENQPHNVREANAWLKRQGVTQWRFQSRQDSMYGRVFLLQQKTPALTDWVTLFKSPGLGELIEHVIVYGQVRRDWAL